MIGLGEVSPITLVEGKLQAEVGKFLMMKAELVKLQSHGDFDVRKNANLLLTRQYQLEKDLQTGLNTIEVMKSGAYTVSDITKVGQIAYEINKHSKAVNALKARAAGAGTITAPSGVSSLPMAAIVAAGVGLIALGVFSRR